MKSQEAFIDRILQFLTQEKHSSDSNIFIKEIAEFLTNLFQVSYILIDKYSKKKPKVLKTKAVYSLKEGILPNMTYDIAFTPCHNIITSIDLCVYLNGRITLTDNTLKITEEGEVIEHKKLDKEGYDQQLWELFGIHKEGISNI